MEIRNKNKQPSYATTSHLKYMRNIFFAKNGQFFLRLSISHFLVDGRYLSHILLDLQNLYYVVSSGSVATCIIIFMKHT